MGSSTRGRLYVSSGSRVQRTQNINLCPIAMLLENTPQIAFTYCTAFPSTVLVFVQTKDPHVIEALGWHESIEDHYGNEAQ